MDDIDYNALLEEAQAYNETLVGKSNRFILTDEELAEYESLLSVSGTNVIGYIEIAKISCYLPIYHGTDDSVLQLGVGHLEGSSLPVGGESTHAVISGHRGLPNAKLFTDLDKLEVGDTFKLYILNEVLTYEVDQIRIVEPQEIWELEIVEGEDYCTLVTCTPYGINTHRLLVRGHRIENEDADSVRVTADAMQVDASIVALLIAVPILLLLLIILMVRTRKRPGKVLEGPQNSETVFNVEKPKKRPDKTKKQPKHVSTTYPIKSAKRSETVPKQYKHLSATYNATESTKCHEMAKKRNRRNHGKFDREEKP